MGPRKQRSRLLRMKKADKAWLAAVIDCEGCIGLSQCRKAPHHYYTPRLTVTNTYLPLLTKCLEITGVGRIRENLGVHKHNPRAKRTFRWVVERFNDLQPLLRILAPNLLIKRLQAENILAYIDVRLGMTKYGSQEQEIYEKIRQLNAVGDSQTASQMNVAAVVGPH